MDLYIGEKSYLGKGIAVALIKQFLTQYVWQHFEHCFVDADIDNVKAIHAYEKAGFKRIKQLVQPKVLWLLKSR